MTALPHQLERTLDRAIAAAKRAGHEQATALHLAAALLEQDPERYAAVFGTGQVAALEAALYPTPNYVRQIDPEPAREILLSIDDRDLGEFVLEELERVLPTSPQPGPADPGTSPSDGSGGLQRPSRSGAAIGAGAAADDDERAAGRTTPALPSALNLVADVLPARPGVVIDRDGEVDQILGHLARRSPWTPLIVGASGSGRTAIAGALATRLADADYGGPLAGSSVIRVDAAEVIARERASTLRAALDGARSLPDPVIVLDDLELLAGLGWGQSIDMATLAVVRAAVADPDLRLVLVIDDRFITKLASHDRELAEEVRHLELPPLSAAGLAEIGRRAGQDLAEHHGIELPDEVIAAAMAPAPPEGREAHPALLVHRLDGACVRAALQQRERVELDDLDLGDALQAAGIDGLESHLRRCVVGQDVAVERVAGRLALTRRDMDLRPERPDGVFLFVGPTGVGKTAFARALAEGLGQGEPIRLDMSEYTNEAAINRLIGSPPGYVGSTDPEGWLTTQLRRRPDAVVLLDEIEKSHPTVWNTFLQAFDAGRLSDAHGGVVDLSDTIFVMTSNLGAAKVSRPEVGFTPVSSGPDGARSRVISAVRGAMPPELFNRIDDVIVFDPLSASAIHEIAEREIEAVIARLGQEGLVLELGDGVLDLVAEQGYEPAFGARHLQRNIEQLLLIPAARHTNGRYRVRLENGELVFESIP